MIALIEGFCNIHIEGSSARRKFTVRMRLDHLLVLRGYAETRSKAQDLIRRGMVRVKDKTPLKTGIEVAPDEDIQVLDSTAYVARSAWKLIAALDHFGFTPDGRICLDAGSSTGGFTQVLLERGAAAVYAVDVGRGQLHSSLKSSPKVISLEETDARSLTPRHFDAQIQAITCDVSFISLLKVLPNLLTLAAPGAWIIALVKPQFEVGRALIGKGGIVKDAEAKAEAVTRVLSAIGTAHWDICGALPSPIAGQNGNEETLVAAIRRG
jgi:23S rRNA (cytidine1920-2'-O)/16S rRNA (cytidine1409-2'-O)-methyltransferase